MAWLAGAVSSSISSVSALAVQPDLLMGCPLASRRSSSAIAVNGAPF
jgi:hypothetical protein